VLVLLVPALAVAATVGDVTSVAWVVLGDLLASTVFISLMTARRAGIGYAAQWRSVQPIALACLPAWAATRAASDLLDDGGALLGLVAAVGAGAAAYLVTLSILDRGLLRDAARQIAMTFGREPRTERT
jgi:hypothetical protein